MIIGVVLAVWGAVILIINLAGGSSGHGNSAYSAGQTAALVFAIIMVVAGIRAVFKGLQQHRS
jgi:hypothetical protein